MIKPLQTSKSDNIVTSEFVRTPTNDKQSSRDRGHSGLTNENSPIRCGPDDSESEFSGDSAKKVNFRERIRNLRETCRDGPLLASTEDIPDMEDDDGFILASRTKKGRKIKSPKIASFPDDNLNSLLQDSVSPQDIAPVPETTSMDNDVIKLTQSQNSNMEKRDSNHLLIQNYEEDKVISLSCEEVVSRIKVLKEELDNAQDMKSENLERKSPWCNKTENSEKRVLDFNECSICYQPWTEDKVILEECGHCFHSECIRLWMKRKSTCPFCATFSLLLDDFPKLS